MKHAYKKQIKERKCKNENIYHMQSLMLKKVSKSKSLFLYQTLRVHVIHICEQNSERRETQRTQVSSCRAKNTQKFVIIHCKYLQPISCKMFTVGYQQRQSENRGFLGNLGTHTKQDVGEYKKYTSYNKFYKIRQLLVKILSFIVLALESSKVSF